MTRRPDRSVIERRFTSDLRDQRAAAWLGIALGVTFTTAFATGVFSHLAQHPPSWFRLPARPAGLYRLTQGIHVATGIASIPLLLAKLWVVIPKLFRWPPFSSVAHFVERVLLVPLVGGSLFLLVTGLANINLWYPWSFNFPIAHYWAAWITIGALIAHTGAKWTTTRTALAHTTTPSDLPGEPTPNVVPDQAVTDRRRFLATVLGVSGLVTLFTIGQTVRPLAPLALLAPRRPNIGPQGFPVNRTARAAGVLDTATADDYRLVVAGNVRRPLMLSLDDLRALTQHSATLPIACVDGWSTSQRWTGVRLRDLLAMAGARHDAELRVESLQQGGSYGTSDVNRWQAHDPDTLLALLVNDEPLDIDHGYPMRLIGPDRAGVMQTKWVSRLVVR
jgi:DMSO/TMAO reductase YedYZ molybdopterin-dependent catalytic subunit